MTGDTETTSLLPANDDGSPSVKSTSCEPTNKDGNSDQLTRSGIMTVVLCCLFIILFEFADILRFTPSLHLLELGYCRRYYSEHNPWLIDPVGNIPERSCKLQEIQEDLASMRGWFGSIEGLIGFVLVIPYGVLSEKKGGRYVAALNLLGYALSSVWILVVCYFWRTFPIDAIVVSPMLRAIGGGAPVCSAVVLALVANAVPTAKRSSVFFLMSASGLVTEMIMPLASTALLSNGFVYTPFFLGFVFEGLALLAIYNVPIDTATVRSGDSSTTSSSMPSGDDEHPLGSGFGDPKSGKLEYLTRMLKEGNILTDAKIVTLLACFGLAKVGRPLLDMLVQYISTRYGWSFAKANIVFSIRAGGSLILFLSILPISKQILQDVWHVHTDRVDYLLAVTGNAFLIAGSLCMGLAHNIPVFMIGLVISTLGGGYQQSLRSLISSFVERKYLTRLYTIIALFDGLGVVVWALLVNGSLKLGIHKGAAWIGLPFFIATAAYSASVVVLCIVQDRRPRLG